jgi:hypothetical protein
VTAARMVIGEAAAPRTAHGRQAGQVERDVGALEQPRQVGGEDVRLDEMEAGIGVEPGEVLRSHGVAGRGPVVDAGDDPAPAEELDGQVRADEAGYAGDESMLHVVSRWIGTSAQTALPLADG